MNDIREMVREAIREYITISKTDIERALEDIDLTGMIDDAVKSHLPYAIMEIAEQEINDIVAAAVSDALS